mgnify:FL=1
MLILRKLTEKSTIGFGKFNSLRVGDLLAIQNHTYLRWVYFNASMIDFFEEILDEIGIDPEWRIDKPGKDPEKGEELAAQKRYNRPFKSRMHYASTQRKRSKSELINLRERERLSFSKASLMSRNQGH